MTDRISEVRAVIAAVMEVDAATLPNPASVDTVGTWDSVRHLELIETLAHHFVCDFSAGEIVDMLDEDAIVRIVCGKTSAE